MKPSPEKKVVAPWIPPRKVAVTAGRRVMRRRTGAEGALRADVGIILISVAGMLAGVWWRPAWVWVLASWEVLGIVHLLLCVWAMVHGVFVRALLLLLLGPALVWGAMYASFTIRDRMHGVQRH